jgi:hypothetical protein
MVSVVVSPPTTVKVQVNNNSPTVQKITYATNSLKNANDLILTGAADGDVITYDAANNDFVLTPPNQQIPEIDGGTF